MTSSSKRRHGTTRAKANQACTTVTKAFSVWDGVIPDCSAPYRVRAALSVPKAPTVVRQDFRELADADSTGNCSKLAVNPLCREGFLWYNIEHFPIRIRWDSRRSTNLRCEHCHSETAKAASQAILNTIKEVEEALCVDFPRGRTPSESRSMMKDMLRVWSVSRLGKRRTL